MLAICSVGIAGVNLGRNMTKFISFLLLIIFSVVVVFFTKEIQMILHWIAQAHDILLNKLTLLIHGGQTAKLIQLSLSLILIPLILALIPAFIYWLFKRRMLPDYLAVVWAIWFVLVALVSYR